MLTARPITTVAVVVVKAVSDYSTITVNKYVLCFGHKDDFSV